jgi:hypothetical protein
MRYASLVLLVLPSAFSATSGAQYLASIHQRWQASDLVCIGRATSPVRTGEWRKIDGTDRDELSTQVQIERCLKGDPPATQDVRIIGYDVVAAKDVSAAGGWGYAGPPIGFVSQGRNLLFLRRSRNSDQFEVTVPVYETAIHLADSGVEVTAGGEPQSARSTVTQELEAAAVQFGDTDLSYYGYLFDYLGTREGIAELSRFAQLAPLAVQRDAAVAIMFRGQASAEPAVIALMLDASAPIWKRANAASALADHGTAAALEPLEQLAAQSAGANERDEFYLTFTSSLARLKHRLQVEQSR